jgi:polyphenol oxidase
MDRTPDSVTRLCEQSAVLRTIDNISHGFFSRQGGTSPPPWRGLNIGWNIGDAPARVEENLARIRFQIGVTRRALFAPKQVHGDHVIEVSAQDSIDDIAEIEADAILTDDPGIGVGVRTADCVPILLASSDGHLVGAIHAGWRGIVRGIIESTFHRVESKGYRPFDMRVAIGPCIGPSAFEVGPDVVEGLIAKGNHLEQFIRNGEGDRSFVDLKSVCANVMDGLGLRNIDEVGGCTYSSTERYFSHRHCGGKTGRQMSCVATVRPPEIDPNQYR